MLKCHFCAKYLVRHGTKYPIFSEQILRKGSRILPPGTRLCKQCSTSLQSLFKVSKFQLLTERHLK